MATAELRARLREDIGKEAAKRVRRGGDVPGVLYGEGNAPVSLVVSSKEFYHVTHTRAGSNVILDLKIDGSDRGECKAIVREIQYHPVRRDVLHVDFQEISMTKPVHVSIPVEPSGEAVGVKTKGGILELLHREVEIRCLPTDIPESIRVNVAELDVGDSIQVKDLTVDAGVIIDEPETTVITIVAPTVIEEKRPAEEEVEGEVPAEEAEEAEEGKEAKEGKKGPEAGTSASE
jgi:large subunit ribosomal protein L25